MGGFGWGGAKRGDGELQAAIAAIHRSQAVIEFDLSGAILTANANFLATMGYALDEIEGQHHSLFVEPAYRDSQAYADFWARLNAGEFLSDKFQRVAKGGRPVWIQASYNPILDARGKPYKVIKFATDITAIERERAEREAERRESAAGQDHVVGALATALRRVASGDLTARIDAAFDGRYQTIKDDFNVAVDSLRVAMGAISQSSDQLRNGAAEIAAASQDLSHRTEQQASSLEHTASALNEITTTVEHNADNARQASQSATNARAAALHSGEVMGEAILAMGEIERSSRQITDVIGLIDEIAFQTNLLALNAGVEAARAGDAGRGFAVVAQEVRALSQRSAEAAKEIKSLIANSTRQVGRGVKLVAETDQALSGIVAKVAEIDGLMSSIAQSSKEQADRLNTVNGGVDHMNQVTQQNAVMVEQASAAARGLSREATELVRQVASFRTGAQASVAPPAPQRLSA